MYIKHKPDNEYKMFFFKINKFKQLIKIYATRTLDQVIIAVPGDLEQYTVLNV